jgi:hypothetical protein
MALRAMNNKEKANAKMLKGAGFHVFFQYSGVKGEWWATHPKLICQYHIATMTDEALSDLKEGKLYRHA